MDMTSEGLAEIFKVSFRHARQEISTCVDGGMSGPVKRVQTGSKDTHQHKRKFSSSRVLIELTRGYIEHILS